jgi:nucleoside-diphosphate-sugar epimerase
MIYGDGTQTRDFTSVHDIVNGTLLAANAEAAVGEVFNLASGNTITVNEALAKLEASLKTRAVEAAHEPAKPWDPAVTHADIRKAKQLLGYSPRTSFDEGLRQFAEWVLNQLQTN